MTNSQNIESLIRQHAALKAELAIAQGKLDAIRDKLLANNHNIMGSPSLVKVTPSAKIRMMRDIFNEIFAIVKHEYRHIEIKPAAEAEAIAPKFKVGDKVRIVGRQETPLPVSDYGRGGYDTIYSIEANGGYKVSYTNGVISTLVWFDYELAPYNDTEAPKPDLSFIAHDDATSQGCQMCGNEWKSLNEQGYCSSCWTVWNS